MSHPLVAGRALTALGTALCTLSLASADVAPPQGRGFVEALRASGWQVELLPDGSLQLVPGSRAETAAAADQPPAAGAGDTAAQGAAGWDALRASGWRVEGDPDGSTRLYPPPPRAPEPPPEAAPEPATSESPAVSPDPGPDGTAVAAAVTADASAREEIARDLDALLAQRGWRAERASDGSLLLYPLRRESAPATAVERATGLIPPAVGGPGVSLPIDTWEEATRVASSWLESVGATDLRIGKVRRILRVYLVSILDDRSPHQLRHQISIGVDDGRVVVLN